MSINNLSLRGYSRGNPVFVFWIASLAFAMTIIFFGGAPLASASTLQRQPNNLGLKGYWSLDDGVGTIA